MTNKQSITVHPHPFTVGLDYDESAVLSEINTNPGLACLIDVARLAPSRCVSKTARADRACKHFYICGTDAPDSPYKMLEFDLQSGEYASLYRYTLEATIGGVHPGTHKLAVYEFVVRDKDNKATASEYILTSDTLSDLLDDLSNGGTIIGTDIVGKSDVVMSLGMKTLAEKMLKDFNKSANL